MRQTKVSFCLTKARANVGEKEKGEKKRKKRKKKEKEKKTKLRYVFVLKSSVFGFLGFLVWIIRPLYGFPWFLGFALVPKARV